MKRIALLIALLLALSLLLPACVVRDAEEKESGTEAFTTTAAVTVTETWEDSTEPEETTSPEPEPEPEPARDYLDERDYLYGNKLAVPTATVSDIRELMAVCDYHAFYKDENFVVTLTDDYRYSTDAGDLESELNYLYWHSELINGAMGLTAAKGKTDPNKVLVTYVFYHNAYVESEPYFTAWTDVAYREPNGNRGADYDDFATEDLTKPVCDVATTQQLWYAAEHGYRINCLAGSPAEKYYGMAKDLLRSIIRTDMTDLQKLETIYDYIDHHATYDYTSAYNAPPVPNPKLFPDEYAATCKCFFIEGFFDDPDGGLVVCDGFSKIYTLLGRMEGLEIIRGSGTSDTEWKSRETMGHAYCFVRLGDVWYLSCPTWGQTHSETASFTNHNWFLAPHSFIDPYRCRYWADLNLYDNVKSYVPGNYTDRYFADQTFSWDGKIYSCTVRGDTANYTAKEQCLAIMEAVHAEEFGYMDFYCLGKENYDLFCGLYQESQYVFRKAVYPNRADPNAATEVLLVNGQTES